MSSENIALLTLAAVFAGFIAGLFGLGGGVVVVPVVYALLLAAHVSSADAMPMAIATSLVAVLCTGGSSMLAHWRYRHIDWSMVKIAALPLALGAGAGALLVAQLRSPWLGVGFGLFLWVVATTRLRGRVSSVRRAVHVRVIAGVAALIGFISTLVGVGGGTMTVPALQTLGRTMPIAVGSSAAAGVILSAVASVVLLNADAPQVAVVSIGLVYWPALVVLVPAAMVVAPMGAKCAKVLPEQWLRRGFIGLLVINGAWVLVSNARAVMSG